MTDRTDHGRRALGLILVLAASAAAIAEEPIGWSTDARAAMESAAASGKPVLVDLWAIWCVPCKEMEETTYQDPRVVRAFEEFVPLKVDADANEIFVERYEVEGFPTTLFLDGQGREITRRVSYVGPDEMLDAMESVLEGYDAYRERVDRRDDAEALRAAADYLLRAGNPGGAADLLRDALKLAESAGADAIELELSVALTASGREGAAVKLLKRLSNSASSDSVRAEALIALVRTERDRGRTKQADAALTRLRTEFPDHPLPN